MTTITLPASCPHCQAPLTATSVVTPTPGGAAKVALKDWRIWAVVFACTVVAGVLAGVFHIGTAAVGGAAGAVGGLMMARRMATVRLCSGCGKAVT